MPHKVTNSHSTLSSHGSSSTGASDRAIVPDIRGSNPVPRRSQRPPVIVHNQAGRIYDEIRPSDWDNQRWK